MKKITVSLILAVLLLTIFLIAWRMPLSICESDISVCFFRTLTNRPCPFCGLTRALIYAAHGEFEKAFDSHPLWWLAPCLIMTVAMILLLDAAGGTNLSRNFRRLAAIPTWLIALALAVLVVIRLWWG